jgi:hypothetical protein
MTMTQRFFNARGQAYAHITAGGILVKNEKQKDRLNILDKKGYAVDVALLNQAMEYNATALEIKEKTLTGSQRIYRASLTDLKKYSKVVTLAGVTRYAFSLAICNLISGTPEPWQIAEHARWLSSQSETPTAREEQPQRQQAILFDTQELQDLALSGRLER